MLLSTSHLIEARKNPQLKTEKQARQAETGRRGERAAAKYYLSQGYTLLEHNYRTRLGELDLVLRSPQGVIVICEVKTRSPDSWDIPAASVTIAKQKKVILAAKRYLQLNHLLDEYIRFDVAEVIPVDEKHCKVHIIEDAFLCH